MLGGSGFIGKPLLEYLTEKGHSVENIDLVLGEEHDLRKLKLDLAEIDCVLYLAWDVGGSKYLYKKETQLQQLEWNVSMMANIFPQLASAGVRFVFASSQLADEVETVYGVTKRLGEHWTKLYSGSIVRFWNAYGPIEEVSERSHVVSDMLSSALDNGVINLATDGSEQRQFVHIEDLCRAVERVSTEALPGPYDITSFSWISILEVAQIIAELTGATIYRGNLRGKTQKTTLSGRIPGWFPEIELRDGLKRMIRAYSTSN